MKLTAATLLLAVASVVAAHAAKPARPPTPPRVRVSGSHDHTPKVRPKSIPPHK